ncbi:hypothetical protein ACI782_05670 [Geodermatophilus sp. SYSU D00703]
MLHQHHGRRSSLFTLSLAAMLVWTGAIADPAFAIHNRSRAFSIVADGPDEVPAPDTFTCRFVETENGVPVLDYRCTSSDGAFNELLTEQGSVGLIGAGATADGDLTKLRSPSEFTCTHNGGGSRLPRDFDCDPNRGRNFTLADFAYVHPVKDDGTQDENVTYALPCRPCVATNE